jgi:hypothetical protein
MHYAININSAVSSGHIFRILIFSCIKNQLSDSGGSFQVTSIMIDPSGQIPPGRVTDLQVISLTVLRIRIRIRMFLGILDPDPLVRGMDPDPAPDPSIIMQK